jgi:NADH dehydrogenase
MRSRPKVVIIGGGFGGLWAAKALSGEDVDVALIDRKNHHVFQPLLYQVATAVLSPGEIASPIRRILHHASNIEVVLGEAAGFDKERNVVRLEDGSEVAYDYLILSAGARHSYFGHDQWETAAPGLKTLEDAVEMRRRVLLAFEIAERELYLAGEKRLVSIVVVGGGPTGVELAGAVADIARQAMAKDFKMIDTRKARVVLFEGGSRVLAAFPEDLSRKAKAQLEDLGVEVRLNSFVSEIEAGRVKVGEDWIDCDVVLWATGVAASPLGKALGVDVDKAGRVPVAADLTVPGFPNIFVIGDMATLKQENGEPVPGLAPAAMQMGKSAARNILRDVQNKPRKDFRYVDKGTMATIGRRRAIADIRGWKFSGFIAWMMWLCLHIVLLIGFRNRFYVLSEWFWAYLTRERSARLITGDAEDLRNALLFMQGDAAAAILDKLSNEKAMSVKSNK